MVLVGAAFLTFWLLVQVFTVAVDKAALVTAIIFLVLGLLLDYRGTIETHLRKP